MLPAMLRAFCALFVFAPLLALAQPVFAADPKDEFLALICAKADIVGHECRNAIGYTSSEADERACIVQAENTKIVTGHFLPGRNIEMLGYISDCEGHSNYWGGTLLAERTDGVLRFLGYDRGSQVEDCLTYIRPAIDELYCVGDGRLNGDQLIAFGQYTLSADGSTYALTGRALITGRDSDGNYGAQLVGCGNRIEYFDFGNLRAGTLPNTIAMDVTYADAPLIAAACAADAPPVKEAFTSAPTGSALLASAAALTARYVYHTDTGAFAAE
jgi:hypothetical protein